MAHPASLPSATSPATLRDDPLAAASRPDLRQLAFESEDPGFVLVEQVLRRTEKKT
jgi:hypothetical protein